MVNYIPYLAGKFFLLPFLLPYSIGKYFRKSYINLFPYTLLQILQSQILYKIARGFSFRNTFYHSDSQKRWNYFSKPSMWEHWVMVKPAKSACHALPIFSSDMGLKGQSQLGPQFLSNSINKFLCVQVIISCHPAFMCTHVRISMTFFTKYM